MTLDRRSQTGLELNKLDLLIIIVYLSLPQTGGVEHSDDSYTVADFVIQDHLQHLLTGKDSHFYTSREESVFQGLGGIGQPHYPT